MDDINLRLADSSDFSSLKELMLNALKSDSTAFSVSYSEYSTKDNYWWHEYLDPFLYGDSQQMILAETEGKLIGCGGIIFENRERKKHSGTLVWFYTLPEHRGKGVGKSILSSIFNLAKDRNLLKITLMANENQVIAINLYKKHGFKMSGRLEKELKIDDKFYDVLLLELFL